MRYYAELGICAPEYAWVPSPSYILRRGAVLEMSKSWHPGHILEIGSGSGALLVDFAKRKFTCHGIDTSEIACQLAQKIVKTYENVTISQNHAPNSCCYDYLVSLEVLEHIEDDYRRGSEQGHKKPHQKCDCAALTSWLWESVTKAFSQNTSR